MARQRVGEPALFVAQESNAQLTTITSKTDFGTPTGIIHWAQLGTTGSAIDNPSAFTVSGIPGLTGTVEEPYFHFKRRTQSFNWDGNFTPGDELLWTVGNNGPMIFDFSAAIHSFGTQIDDVSANDVMAQLLTL